MKTHKILAIFFLSGFLQPACWADGTIRGYVDDIKFYASGVVNVTFLEAQHAGGSGLQEFNGYCNSIIQFTQQTDTASELYYSLLLNAKATGKQVRVSWDATVAGCLLDYADLY